jgi:WXG100 family type VII secretion target
MAADEIRGDYEELQKVAQRFNAQSQAIQQMAQQVKNGMSKLEGSWEGRGSDSFFREMTQLVIPGVTRLQKALQQAAQSTAKIANTLKQAETEASSLFKAN